MGRKRHRASDGERLANGLRRLASGADPGAGHDGHRHHGGSLHPVGPTVRIVCSCGALLHVGTGTGPATWDGRGTPVCRWTCQSCGKRWEVPALQVFDAIMDARAGDRTVRLPPA